jgi:hypothetical protein
MYRQIGLNVDVYGLVWVYARGGRGSPTRTIVSASPPWPGQAKNPKRSPGYGRLNSEGKWSLMTFQRRFITLISPFSFLAPPSTKREREVPTCKGVGKMISGSF